jgi:hypothetical protein
MIPLLLRFQFQDISKRMTGSK